MVRNGIRFLLPVALALVALPSPHASGTATRPAGKVQAVAPEGLCPPVSSGTGAWSIYKIYYNPQACKIPLRVGTSTWGYNHLVSLGRWNETNDNNIGASLLNPDGSYANPNNPATSRVYCHWWTSGGTRKTWKTVVEYAEGSNGMKGIITGFNSNGWTCSA
jgi:hypothetical protein